MPTSTTLTGSTSASPSRDRESSLVVRRIAPALGAEIGNIDLAESLSVGVGARADVYLKRSAALRREQR